MKDDFKNINHQDLDVCSHSFARYWEKCFTQIALYGDAMLVGQHGGRKVTETFVIAIETKCHYSRVDSGGYR